MPHIHVHVTGIVQGVGYRPFVWKLATSLSLAGWVRNSSDGVHIEAKGAQAALDSFVLQLSTQKPGAARIDTVHVDKIASENVEPYENLTQEAIGLAEGSDFRIIESSHDADRLTLVSPDIATCPQCMAELTNPSDRRYHYPFINCTNCGPRFTIVEDLPYDRPLTAMKHFTMCEACEHEYRDPSNRRFHAQPNACFECGPHITWRIAREPGRVEYGADVASSDAIIKKAAQLLAQGGIVAIKGLGGFHLACNACDEAAVMRLRERKHRPTKPLAVMFSRFDEMRRVCVVSTHERDAILGSVKPICLLQKKPDDEIPPKSRLAHAIAFDLPEIGAMLPYTPLQQLLLDACSTPLVMTSGNITHNPIITDDQLCVSQLMDVADAWIGHDREILARYDDSVVRFSGNQMIPIRRARGMAPMPVTLPMPPLEQAISQLKLAQPEGFAESITTLPTVFASGPEQKATFTFARGEEAFVSQYIGDLAHADVFDAWLESKATFEKLFDLHAGALACDLHPGYLSSQWAREEAQETGLPLIEVQHHHAHIAATLAEYGIWDQVVGIALDGTGAGTDGTVWGGEILVCDQADFVRGAHLAAWHLPGAEVAILKPVRTAYALLDSLGMGEVPLAQHLLDRMSFEGPVVKQMLARHINCPLTSSAGRLFDAVAAMIGLLYEAGYDGEAACLLEACAMKSRGEENLDPRYTLVLRPALDSERLQPHDESLIIDMRQLVCALLEDIEAGVAPELIAWRFHMAFADGIAQAALGIARASGLKTVALGGGVFQNRLITQRISDVLISQNITVLYPHVLPVNDGSISYGQAAVARARLAQEIMAKLQKNVPSQNNQEAAQEGEEL
ncbi:MAG: carbamoyltransferase HypF [Coriobacteriales bacterium]|nr:carbamoyltransferase HypF [Coriobacteriales bacterium]